MANNRMWLVNARTGQRLNLAKYYPSTGWYTNQTKVQEFWAAFAPDGVCDGPGTMYGDEWRLEYDVETPK